MLGVPFPHCVLGVPLYFGVPKIFGGTSNLSFTLCGGRKMPRNVANVLSNFVEVAAGGDLPWDFLAFFASSLEN